MITIKKKELNGEMLKRLNTIITAELMGKTLNLPAGKIFTNTKLNDIERQICELLDENIEIL